MNEALRKELAPAGTLRAGINLSNFLLVTGRSSTGDPQGVAPDLAAEIATRLDVPLTCVPFDTPAQLADAARADRWDIGLIGAEPARARFIAFTAAYVEIEATYLVPANSPLYDVAGVDREGIRIAVSAGSAYDLYLSRTVRNAELVRADGLDASCDLFVKHELDALAGLRPRLISDLERLPGARILDGRFTAVQQAVGTPPDQGAGSRVPAGLRRRSQGERARAALDRTAPRARSVGRGGLVEATGRRTEGLSMSWWGKVIGGAFGFMLGGPLGALFGAALGHSFDRGLRAEPARTARGRRATPRVRNAPRRLSSPPPSASWDTSPKPTGG